MNLSFDNRRQPELQQKLLPEYGLAIRTMLAQGPNSCVDIKRSAETQPKGHLFYLALQAECGTDVAGLFVGLAKGNSVTYQQYANLIPELQDLTRAKKWEEIDISAKARDPLPLLLQGRTEQFERSTFDTKVRLPSLSPTQIEAIQTKLPTKVESAKSWALGYLKLVSEATDLGIVIQLESHGAKFITLLREAINAANKLDNLPNFDKARGDLDRQDLHIFNAIKDFKPYLG